MYKRYINKNQYKFKIVSEESDGRIVCNETKIKHNL